MSLFRGADFGAPLIESSFYSGDCLGADHAGEGEYEDTDKNLVGLESSAGNRDHETDSGGGGVKLADHDAHNGSPEPEPETR